MDPDLLKRLRAEAAAVRADIEERERRFDEDPVANHDKIMEMLGTPVVEKEYKQTADDISPPDNGYEPAPFTDEQLDIISAALAEFHMGLSAEIDDAIAPLQQRLSVLEGKIDLLVSLIGNDRSNKIFEASETVRKLNVR